MFSDILNLNVFIFLIVFCRVAGALMVMPVFADAQIPMDIQLAFALAVAFVLTPVVGKSVPPIPESASLLILLVVSEIVIGVFLGAVARTLIGALHVAGSVIAFVSSLANAMVWDPITEQQGALVTGYLGLIALVLVLVSDLHHLMLKGIADSYTLFVPGHPLSFHDAGELLSRHVAGSFRLGVQLAAPFVIFNLAFNLALGLLSRLMPQMQVFFVGLPFQLAANLLLMGITTSAIFMVFLRYYEDALAAFLK